MGGRFHGGTGRVDIVYQKDIFPLDVNISIDMKYTFNVVISFTSGEERLGFGGTDAHKAPWQVFLSCLFHPLFKHHIHLVISPAVPFLLRQGNRNDQAAEGNPSPLGKSGKEGREGFFSIYPSTVFQLDNDFSHRSLVVAEGVAAMEMVGVGGV